jgi:hypothetical protein
VNAAFIHDGEVYVLRGGGPAYRVLALPSQVPLIYQLKDKEQLELCSESLIAGELAGPKGPDVQAVLARLAGPLGQAARAGGPRPLTPTELAALELAHFSSDEFMLQAETLKSLKSCNFVSSARALEAHPAMRSGLGFAFNNLLTPDLIRLLGMIYDVRRFGCAEHPGRASRFKMYFRLASPRIFFALYEERGQEASCLLHVRINTLLRSWLTHPFFQLSDTGLQLPERFLFREHHAARAELRKTKSDTETEVLSVWQTCARLSTFIYRLWLHGVGDTRFIPEMFFNHQDEVDSFKKHVKCLDNRTVSSA